MSITKINKAYVYQSRIQDAIRLAPDLREEDVAEVRAASGSSPLDALAFGVMHGWCWTIADDDGPVSMFGVCPSNEPGTGTVWLLASPRLLNHRRQLIRESHHWLRVMMGYYPTLTNYIDTRNKEHLRYVQWLGADFFPYDFGFNGVAFRKFTLCAPQQPSH